MKQSYKRLSLFLLTFIFAFTAKSQSITFSELNYNSDSTLNSGNWVELYNFGNSQIDLSGWLLKNESDLNVFTIPGGTILQPNAHLVIVDDSVKFHTINPFINNYVGKMPFTFGNNGDKVRLFDNTGVLKVYMEYADSTPWPTAADGTGRTLEISDPNQSADSAYNWFVGCMGGSPGLAYSPCNDPIVFGEINYHSDSTKDAGDWVELWNHSAGYVNLNGWSFKDSKNSHLYDIPANTQLAPDARLVLVNDTAKFFSRHPNVTNWAGPFDFSLDNKGELIRLYDFSGRLKFSIVYNDHGNWPGSADGEGYTLELLDANSDMNKGTDWFPGCPEGSPGYAFTPNCNVGIPPVSSQPFQIFNDPANHALLIKTSEDEFHSGSRISIYNLVGEEIFSSELNQSLFTLDTNEFSPGMFVAYVYNGKNFLTAKFIVQ